MTEGELEELTKVENVCNLIDISMLSDKSDRTLLWGYTCNRASWLDAG